MPSERYGSGSIGVGLLLAVAVVILFLVLTACGEPTTECVRSHEERRYMPIYTGKTIVPRWANVTVCDSSVALPAPGYGAMRGAR